MMKEINEAEVSFERPPSPFVFASRFLEDFELVRLLGRGAYGRVFEARKKIDEKHYAVKRIKLPSSKEARTKVMREVTVSDFLISFVLLKIPVLIRSCYLLNMRAGSCRTESSQHCSLLSRLA